MKNRKSWITGFLITALGLTVVFFSSRVSVLRPEPATSDRCKQVLDELFSCQLSIRYLCPDPSVRTLAYIDGGARGIRLLDLQNLKQTLVKVPNEITRLYGWSSDGRYLAFAQMPSQPDKLHKKGVLKEEWITFYDRQKRSIKRATDRKVIVENHFAWLGTNTCVFASRGLKSSAAEFYWSTVNGPQQKLGNYIGEPVAMGDEKIAFPYYSEKKGHEDIYSMPVSATEAEKSERTQFPERLSNFGKKGFGKLEWLRYSTNTGRFLFCARPRNSKWRYLFEFDPEKSKTNQLTQLSTEDTYNGQYLEEGCGFAYVINTNNSFQLAIRPKDAAGNTNLFTKGNVVNYTVSPGGDHIYVTAAEGFEPQGIWEYNVTNRAIRQVNSGFKKPLATSCLIQPVEFRTKSFDDVEIPCFLFPPAQMTNQTGVEIAGRKIKYPAVIYVPPASFQFQHAFNIQAQTLANLGFYFAAINYRGCDGYGTEFSALANTEDAAKDVLALREELLKNPTIDEQNIFLSTSSAGGDVIFELLATRPKLWRGVVFDKPAVSRTDRLETRKLPPLLMIAGDEDPHFDSIQNFVSWSSANKVEVTFQVHTNSGHITYSSSERKDTQSRMNEFLIAHLKR